MKKIAVAVGILAAGIIASVAWRYYAIQTIQPQQEYRPAPQFTLKDYNGTEVKLSDFAGKPVLVNAWASWCPYCRDELKDFAVVKKEFAERGKEIVILAVNRAESADAARRYSDALGVSSEIIFLLDPDDSFYKGVGGFSMPETIFIDADGKIRQHKRGAMDMLEIRRRIEDAFGFSIRNS